MSASPKISSFTIIVTFLCVALAGIPVGFNPAPADQAVAVTHAATVDYQL